MQKHVQNRTFVPTFAYFKLLQIQTRAVPPSARIPVDRFDYNQAISQSASEQMLLNLVRLRYRDVPTFLAVSAVLTQYTYTSAVGVSGRSGIELAEPSWSVGGSANLRYIEWPTITYSPLNGREFS